MNTSTYSLEEACGIKSYHNTFSRNIPFKLHKNYPENFIVYEILPNGKVLNETSKFGENEPGLFYHCLLRKRLIDTPGAIKILSKELKIPNDWIGYAGLKDAQGITNQRISIFNLNLETISKSSFNNFSLSNFTRKKYEVTLGDLWGNRFLISMDPINKTDITDFDMEELYNILNTLNKMQFPNYFGLQRFGSSRPVSHLIGKFLLKGDYESAVKTYLTNTTKFENENITFLRKELYTNWNYEKFISQIPKHYHYEILLAMSLYKHPNNYFKAFNEIPLLMKKFFISSYQSYIFNELLSKYLTNLDSGVELISRFPIISQNADLSILPDYLRNYLDYLLQKDDVAIDDFKKIKFSFKFNKQQFRKTFVSLADYEFQLNKERLILSFSLPKSSYATMIVRELNRFYDLA